MARKSGGKGDRGFYSTPGGILTPVQGMSRNAGFGTPPMPGERGTPPGPGKAEKIPSGGKAGKSSSPHAKFYGSKKGGY